jgi:DNA-binding NarL/FixJ family response regulator
VSYELHRGPIPDGLQVLHRCDVRACVNPDHLFLGTHDDNMADKVAKGRQVRGEHHGLVRFSDARVCEIVKAVRGGMSKRAAGRHFGLSDTQVRNYVSGAQRKDASAKGES